MEGRPVGLSDDPYLVTNESPPVGMKRKFQVGRYLAGGKRYKWVGTVAEEVGHGHDDTVSKIPKHSGTFSMDIDTQHGDKLTGNNKYG